MNSNKNLIGMQDRRALLSTLWIFITFNIVFADIFSFMFPGFLQQIMGGNAEQIQITPEFLLIAAIVTEIPIAMVFLTRILEDEANRWANLIFGSVALLWVIGGGSFTLQYVFFVSVEIVCAMFIMWYAWNWLKPERQSE
jgi:hypothetical protein